MKVYIHTDIEGVAGVTFFENSRDPSVENANHRQRMRRLLTNEVNAAVRASFDAGAKEVLVNDSHSSGYNILFEELDPRCEIILGRICSGPHWLPEFDKSYDAMVLVGMHAMAGTKCAILPHSLWEVNGGELYLSEATMAAAIAGQHGVPTVFVSGDDKITAEVRKKIPAIEYVAVKKGLSPFQARSLIPQRACELIGQKVKKALGRAKEIKPFVVPGPLRLNLLDSGNHAPPFMRMMSKDVEVKNIEEGFFAVERAMPWCHFDTELPDGFEYP